MSTARRVAKNTTALIVSNILAYMFTFLTAFITARYLGVAAWGVLGVAFSITGIFGILTDLGLSSLTVREVARDKSLARKYYANTTAMKLLLGFLTFGVIAFVVNLKYFHYSQEMIHIFYIITLSMILGSITGVFYSIFQAFEKMEYQSLATIISSITMLTLTASAIYLGLSLIWFAIIYVIVGILGILYILFFYIRNVSLPKLEFDIKFWKPTLKEALPFAVTGVFVNIYFLIDTWMIEIIVGNEAAGIYRAAYTLIMALLFIPTLFITALFPVISRHFESAKELLKLEYEKSFKYLLIVAIFIFIYGFIFANQIITLIYGQKFLLSILALQTLIWVIPIIFLNALLTNIINAVNKQRLVTMITALLALFNVILNLILIPKYSYIGASVATVLTEGLGFVLSFYYISKYYFRIPLIQYLLKPLLAGFTTTVLIFILNTQVHYIIAGIIGVPIYIMLLFVSGIINSEDIEFLKEIINIGNKEE